MTVDPMWKRSQRRRLLPRKLQLKRPSLTPMAPRATLTCRTWLQPETGQVAVRRLSTMEPWLVATATVTLSNVDIIKTEHLQKYKVLLQEYYVNSLKMSRSQSPSISIYFISSTL